MDWYMELRLNPDPEFADTLLMNALFAKLHRALSEAGRGEIGVSFPKAEKTLGNWLRLHGSKEALERLKGLNWLAGMRDHVSVFGPLLVPEKTCEHRTVQRVQAKSSAERLYRRSVRNGLLSAREAEKKAAIAKEQELKLPYVRLKSTSTGQQFRLFIKQGKLTAKPQPGSFSDYGLSNTATVPWF